MKLFEFKIYLGRSPLKPPLPQNKFGEVVEVIIWLYYLGCEGGTLVISKKLLSDMRAESVENKKAYDKAWCLLTPYLRK